MGIHSLNLVERCVIILLNFLSGRLQLVVGPKKKECQYMLFLRQVTSLQGRMRIGSEPIGWRQQETCDRSHGKT